jgi:hypothetical protein
MADDQLSDAQQKQIIDWISSKVPLVGKCAVCHSRTFSIGNHLVTTPVFSPHGMMLGGPQYPFAMLVCDNCGNTQFLNAVRMGIVSNEKSGVPETDTDPSGGAS